MARIRTIKPEFWEDEKIGLLSHGARLLFLCCLNLSDDEGRLRWNTYYLASNAFMYDEIKIETMEKWMKELVDNELIYVYQAGEAKYHVGLVKNFKKHQVINRPQPSKFPPPNDHSDSVNDSVNDSMNGSVSDSLPEREKEREKEREEKRDTDVSPEKKKPLNPDPKKETHPPVPPPPLPDPDFLKFQKWILENAPQVAKLKEPFTQEQYFKIRDAYSGELTADVLMAMHNKKDLLKSYNSAYLTFLNWAKRRVDNGSKNNRGNITDDELGKRLAETAVRLEYEKYDSGEQSADEFERRIGFKPVPRHLRNS